MKSLSILLVDDDEIQRMKFKKACKHANLENTICEAINGLNAMSKLETENVTFDLIISDLNMPKMNGIQLLSKLKNSKKFRNIPFIIMSTSKRIEDLKESYASGVSGYFIKSKEFKEYSQKVTTLLDYWRRSELIS
jgi:CheY-like chemotaxis protein